MKRSEINHTIAQAIAFFNAKQFILPPWGYWSPEQWADQNPAAAQEIFNNGLGWDITDYGGNDFARKGLVLFTIRNGKQGQDKKPYAEKIMISGHQQECPMHFHWHKMEDIINRGGGNLVIELYRADSAGEFSDKPLSVAVDGMLREIAPGGKVILKPGESICLTQGMYHRFYGENGPVLVGEVSSVNDDFTDNRFKTPQGRFPDIEEDEPPKYFLCNDYKKFLNLGQ